MLKLTLVAPLDTKLSLGSLEQALNQWRQLEGNINVKLVEDAEIRELNRQYAGNDYATDVLSFSYDQSSERGDVAISAETAARQAEQAGHSLENEIFLLSLHGILHVLGYDHSTEAQRLEMEDLQKELAAAAGLKYRNISGNH